MHIGIPSETKPAEGRVGLVPEALSALVSAGHKVSVQHNAGLNSGYTDADYVRNGANILADAASVYGAATLIIKVKEPWDPELQYLRSDHVLFCYLHLAALPKLTQTLCDIGLTAIGFETVMVNGELPLLAPMSHIAGKIAVQAGTHYLHSSMGGKGIMLGGLASVMRGNVVVLGAGNAGGHAARLAASMGALVTVFDTNPDKLASLHLQYDNITALYPFKQSLEDAVQQADLLIGSILVPGARATHLVSREQVANMESGSVIVDIAVDQGGCIETTRPTTYDAPVFVDEGVLHFGVTNMPGAVPRTATAALSVALIPYVLALADGGHEDQGVLQDAVNIRNGRVVYPALL